MRRAFIIAMALAESLFFPALAAPEFAPVLQSGMVLQRGEPVVLWGNARSGETVTVEWKGHKTRVKARNGRWQVQLPPSAEDATASRITATDSSGSTTLENILVGDVWLASGQSNMEWTMAQSQRPPANVRLDNDRVRLLRGHGLLHGNPGTYSDELYRKAEECGGYTWEWRVCSAASAKDFSAIATFFALSLQQHLGVPIGIICNARGGSSMEAWIPRSIINKKRLYATMRGDRWLDSDDFDAWSRGRAKQNLARQLERGEKNLRHPFAPGYQYEAGIEPLRKLAIRGVIWYQGESNADTPDIGLNVAKIKDIILSWRQTFRQESLPFLMVQLPRINDPKRPFWPEFREAQQRAANEIEGVGLICTIDLGSTNSNVHPPLKAPIGQRLADLARQQVYGAKGLPTYPRITRAEVSGTHLTLHFSEEVKTTDGKPPRGFALGKAGSRESFAEHEAELLPGGTAVTLPAPGGRRAWRYINTTAAAPNLVGAESGLPVFPHRGGSK